MGRIVLDGRNVAAGFFEQVGLGTRAIGEAPAAHGLEVGGEAPGIGHEEAAGAADRVGRAGASQNPAQTGMAGLAGGKELGEEGVGAGISLVGHGAREDAHHLRLLMCK